MDLISTAVITGKTRPRCRPRWHYPALIIRLNDEVDTVTTLGRLLFGQEHDRP